MSWSEQEFKELLEQFYSDSPDVNGRQVAETIIRMVKELSPIYEKGTTGGDASGSAT